MAHVLGIDVSTTATKAVLVDDDGVVAGSARPSTGSRRRTRSGASRTPELWWTGTIDAIESVLGSAGVAGSDVAAIGLTGQMHGLVLLDASDARPAAGDPLERPADRRRMRRTSVQRSGASGSSS